MEKLSSFKPKVLGAIVISVILSELIWYSYKKYYKPRKPTRKNYPVVNEVIFFTDKGVNCRQHIYRCGSCGNEDCSDYKLRRLIKFLQSAKRTLDICIYMITIQDIADAVKTVHSRGVRVRVIAETGMADNKGSKIPYWRKVGIPVRMKKSPYLMHHKFFIVDDELLATGSFNWTLQAISGNWDNVIVTSQTNIVQPFVSEFEKLWTEFSRPSLDTC
ncbi:mitochondrial cardiolipin hydrolase isoform X1 [Schistocerca americana]|uniref:mitochondrial cardiolipin hydrolase isoform X1 n=1 Tax=Schistocerca americana TaxID=7009 RepID=UPI001F502EEA|nr:mitochondrial cardiolipin hydrolase isoform X1 [Schistocerca americana]